VTLNSIKGKKATNL